MHSYTSFVLSCAHSLTRSIFRVTDLLPPPPLQLTWTVDYNVNRPAAQLGLSNLENKVKIGDVRATLVIQALTNTAEVTLNAGTSM